MDSERALFLEPSSFAFEKYQPLFCKLPGSSGMMVENVSNSKWFLDLMDWGSRKFKLLVWSLLLLEWVEELAVVGLL